MTRHLLGKKSWNVYNTGNVERVKRDEAAAAAREAAEEERMQEVDAERRIKLLRGLPVDDIPENRDELDRTTALAGQDHSSRPERKRKRIAGEDDTDRDIRYAKENQALVSDHVQKEVKVKKASDAPLVGKDGHIDLFPMEAFKPSKAKNPEAAAEEDKKKRELEDQYTMRFSNAAGFKQDVGERPWYSSASNLDEDKDDTSKDVWGNKDPRRKERQTIRAVADDPLAAIQRGIQGVRRAEKERKQWKEEKRREVDDLIKAERRGVRTRMKGHHSDEEDELEGFSLDSPDTHSRESKHRSQRRSNEDRHRHSHSSRKHRSRRRSRSPRRHRRDR